MLVGKTPLFVGPEGVEDGPGVKPNAGSDAIAGKRATIIIDGWLQISVRAEIVMARIKAGEIVISQGHAVAKL